MAPLTVVPDVEFDMTDIERKLVDAQTALRLWSQGAAAKRIQELEELRDRLNADLAKERARADAAEAKFRVVINANAERVRARMDAEDALAAK